MTPPRWRPALVLALCACSSGDAPHKAPAAELPEDSAASGLPEDPGLPDVAGSAVEPSLSAEEVAATLSEALGILPDPVAVTAAYAELMARGDDYCPGNLYNITDIHLYGCDSRTGYHYEGVSHWLAEPIDEETGAEMAGVAGDFWIRTPDGELFEAGGHSVTMTADAFWMRELAGSWVWEGGEPWMAAGYSGTLTLEEDASRGVRMSGGVQVLGVSWSATELMFASACGYGPEGRLGLRDSGGGWYALSFADCDPCATVTFEGAELGEACVDFGPFLAALEALR